MSIYLYNFRRALVYMENFENDVGGWRSKRLTTNQVGYIMNSNTTYGHHPIEYTSYPPTS